MENIQVLKKLGFSEIESGAWTGESLTSHGQMIDSHSPIDNSLLGRIKCADRNDFERIVTTSVEAFREWRLVPAPKRGEIVRLIGLALREHKEDLGAVVSLEVGKIKAEGEGEVQEMIDLADLALGQSRMLYGLTMHSERPEHRMYEQWHPLGPVGVITAFNFPVAVYSWNALISLICGNTVIWKPSHKAALCALAVMKIVQPILQENGLPEGILSLAIGNRNDVGEAMLNDPRIPLVSATGSVRMGQHVASTVSGRLGRTILELGGNNAIIIAPSADLDMATRAVAFGAVGTAGQRCTSTRRLIIHKEIFEQMAERLVKAYSQVPVGNPLEAGTLMGPLIDREAVENMQTALSQVREQGGEILYGGDVLTGGVFDTGTYVTPCLCKVTHNLPVVREETFAPILYLMPYDTIDEAIHLQNDVPQGLSSAVFTNNFREAERFLSHQGSDCGIANVNIGTSGAEIGGAFGGEKETGGGRESGSDVWKGYMRRQTCTLNYSTELPLAQGLKFDV